MKGDPSESSKIFCQKVSQCRKKTEDPLVSPGFVCCAEKKEQLSWLSSLGQMVQFDTLKNRGCRKLFPSPKNGPIRTT